MICYTGKDPRITGIAGGKKAAPSIGKRGLTAQGNPLRRTNAWRRDSDRELSSEDTHPHRTQQVSWLTPLKSRAFSLSQWRTAAPSTITVTGSLGILTRFPILPRPQAEALHTGIQLILIIGLSSRLVNLQKAGNTTWGNGGCASACGRAGSCLVGIGRVLVLGPEGLHLVDLLLGHLRGGLGPLPGAVGGDGHEGGAAAQKHDGDDQQRQRRSVRPALDIVLHDPPEQVQYEGRGDHADAEHPVGLRCPTKVLPLLRGMFLILRHMLFPFPLGTNYAMIIIEKNRSVYGNLRL